MMNNQIIHSEQTFAPGPKEPRPVKNDVSEKQFKEFEYERIS